MDPPPPLIFSRAAVWTSRGTSTFLEACLNRDKEYNSRIERPLALPDPEWRGGSNMSQNFATALPISHFFSYNGESLWTGSTHYIISLIVKTEAEKKLWLNCNSLIPVGTAL